MKSKVKKIVASLLSALMLCSVLSGLNAFAAGETKFATVYNTPSANYTALNPGDTFTETISIGNWSGVALVGGIRTFAANITFDPAKFTFVSAVGATGSGILATGELDSNVVDNVVYFTYLDSNLASPIPLGDVMVVTFTVNTGASGSSDFTLSGGLTWADAASTATAKKLKLHILHQLMQQLGQQQVQNVISHHLAFQLAQHHHQLHKLLQ